MNVKEIVLNAMFIAIVAVLAFVPNLGIISIGPVSITIIHIPVIVAGILLGTKSGLITGTAFGLSTMVVAMMRPVAPTDVLFANPVLSVLPRLLFGISVGIVWKFAHNIFKNRHFAVGVTAALTTFIHAVLVLSILYIFLDMRQMFEALGLGNPSWLAFISAIIVGNTLMEAVAAVVISIPLVAILSKMVPHRP